MASEEIHTMDDLFRHTLEDIYYAEHQIEKALPEMMEKATDSELKRGFRTHLGETKKQIKRLDQVFKKLDQEPKGSECPAIDGIIEEANDVAGEIADKEVLNAALISAAQAVPRWPRRRPIPRRRARKRGAGTAGRAPAPTRSVRSSLDVAAMCVPCGAPHVGQS
jgi:Domain of unknown function (DUF892)